MLGLFCEILLFKVISLFLVTTKTQIMKSALLSFCFLCFSLLAQSQVVISEIMYNPPESGQDSLEYIEITNAGLTTVDISGYHFLQGVQDTVAMGTMLPAGAVYVFSESSSAMNSVLGVSTDQWTDGALSNGGETIELADASSMSIDIVSFDDGGGWPEFDDGTDGAGGSIELCDLMSDNTEPSNWAVSETDTGIELNGNNIFGTPGSENTAMCGGVVADHNIDATPNNVFSPADITINVGEVVAWTNTGGNHNVNGTLATYPDNPEGFDNGPASTDAWTYTKTFTIAGIYDYQCDPHAGLGMVGTVTVIDPNTPSYPVYPIGLVNTVNAEGVADSLGVTCTISGIVHGINFRPSGLQFTIINSDGDGIGLFSASENFGYSVAEGDVVEVAGAISQFNGLTQINPVSLVVTGTDDLMMPLSITRLDEDTESQLVILQEVYLDDPNQWLGDGSSFNLDVTNFGIGGSSVVRIDSDTDIANMSLPSPCDVLQITGIGGQFDQDAPFDSGYQVFPRYMEDIVCILISTNDLLEDGDISISPNPSRNIIHITTEQNLERLEITNMMGQSVLRQNYNAQVDVSNLVAGIYMITFYKEDRSHTIKFIKE